MKKNKPYISIITPNYNGEKYLLRTLKSVFKQSNRDFEYIVIDGRSNDNSIKILKKNKKYINKLIIQKDKGIYDAVEKGIRIARGKVIIWINSDDELHYQAVENVKTIFSNNNKLKWISGVNGYIKYGIKFSGIPYLYPSFLFRNNLVRHDMWGYLQQESVAFKKSLFLKVGGFGLKPTIAGDFKLWIKFAKFASLETYNIKIGYFRTWSEQDSQVKRKSYHKHSKVLFSNISFRYIRLIISLILYPYIFFKTFFLLRKNKKINLRI